jgi:hypothetical protein
MPSLPDQTTMCRTNPGRARPAAPRLNVPRLVSLACLTGTDRAVTDSAKGYLDLVRPVMPGLPRRSTPSLVLRDQPGLPRLAVLALPRPAKPAVPLMPSRDGTGHYEPHDPACLAAAMLRQVGPRAPCPTPPSLPGPDSLARSPRSRLPSHATCLTRRTEPWHACQAGPRPTYPVPPALPRPRLPRTSGLA